MQDPFAPPENPRGCTLGTPSSSSPKTLSQRRKPPMLHYHLFTQVAQLSRQRNEGETADEFAGAENSRAAAISGSGPCSSAASELSPALGSCSGRSALLQSHLRFLLSPVSERVCTSLGVQCQPLHQGLSLLSGSSLELGCDYSGVAFSPT